VANDMQTRLTFLFRTKTNQNESYRKMLGSQRKWEGLRHVKVQRFLHPFENRTCTIPPSNRKGTYPEMPE